LDEVDRLLLLLEGGGRIPPPLLEDSGDGTTMGFKTLSIDDNEEVVLFCCCCCCEIGTGTLTTVDDGDAAPVGDEEGGGDRITELDEFRSPRETTPFPFPAAEAVSGFLPKFWWSSIF
jgi:hypothetical protein